MPQLAPFYFMNQLFFLFINLPLVFNISQIYKLDKINLVKVQSLLKNNLVKQK